MADSACLLASLHKDLRESVRARFALVDAILRMPRMHDAGQRTAIVNDLPGEVKGSIAFSDSPKTHVNNILHACLDYEGGLAALDTILVFHYGTTAPYKELMETVQKLFNENVVKAEEISGYKSAVVSGGDAPQSAEPRPRIRIHIDIAFDDIDVSTIDHLTRVLRHLTSLSSTRIAEIEPAASICVTVESSEEGIQRLIDDAATGVLSAAIGAEAKVEMGDPGPYYVVVEPAEPPQHEEEDDVIVLGEPIASIPEDPFPDTFAGQDMFQHRVTGFSAGEIRVKLSPEDPDEAGVSPSGPAKGYIAGISLKPTFGLTPGVQIGASPEEVELLTYFRKASPEVRAAMVNLLASIVSPSMSARLQSAAVQPERRELR